jgi:ACS family hexuronate transporter-like MFS transporter
MSHYRWVVVAFGFLATIITYLDRSALSYAIHPLQLQFGLTNTDFGMIAAAFGVGYMLMTVIGGVMVDRFGAHKIWSIFAIIWSAACACMGLAAGFSMLLMFRIALGLAEGPSFPAMTRVTADWLPVSERARALAIGLAAVPFASVIGAPLVSWLVGSVGWRWMFLILGVLGIVWAILWFIIFRDKPSESSHVSAAELHHIEAEQQPIDANNPTTRTHKTTWKFMLFNSTFLANNYAFFAFGYLLFFAITWLPGYLEQTYHIKIREAGLFLVAPWLTATILVILGGWISDALWRKTHSIRIARSHLIWICQLLSALCFIPAVVSHSFNVAMISITLGIGFGMMPNAAFYAINADLAHDRAGTSLGIMDCAFAAAGILAPLLTGWLSGITGNFSAAISLMIGLTLSSALAIIIFQHPDDMLKRRPS